MHGMQTSCGGCLVHQSNRLTRPSPHRRRGIQHRVARHDSVHTLRRQFHRSTNNGIRVIKQTVGVAEDATALDRFGNSVAFSGDSVVVGALFHGERVGRSPGPGSVYVFARQGGELVQQAKLTAKDASPGDRFGVSVAISGDTIVVGADDADIVGKDSGAVYVFQRSGTGWIQEAKLTASDAAAGEEFGRSVSISGDTIVVGADDAAGEVVDSGAAYVFQRRGTRWVQQAKLTAEDGWGNDEFGRSVAISGATIVIGAFGADHEGRTDAGAAYVFVRNDGIWTQQAKLIASDAASGDHFGGSRGITDGHPDVAISGNTIVVGAEYADAPDRDSGAAYVFQRTGTVWTERAKLTASDAAEGDEFGESVAISGETIVVGAEDADPLGKDSGAAYVFQRSGTGWIQQIKLTAEDGAQRDFFGMSAAISGQTIVVGATGDDHGDYRNAGSVYVFAAAAER